MRKTETATEYVVDIGYGNGYAPGMGSTYVPMAEDDAFVAGFDGPSTEPWFYVDEWGNETTTILSGYAPVRDAENPPPRAIVIRDHLLAARLPPPFRKE